MPVTTIDLSPPYRVNGEPARYQSLWLLARVCLAARTGGCAVSAAQLQARFPDAANIRMLVSRAFADFARWGVPVGWGPDRGAGVAHLNPARRSRGPFWIEAAACKRLRFTLGTRPAADDALARFLGPGSTDNGARDARDREGDGLAYVMRDISYWSHLTQAMRDMQDGAGGGTQHGIHALRAAQRRATDDFQHAFALLKESLAWRRADDLARSRTALRRFDRIVGTGMVDSALPTFAAMARVVRAWEHYAGNRFDAARAELDSLEAEPALAPVVRYNPRVRFEALNLGALIHKAVAIRDMDWEPQVARQAAALAVAGFSGALQSAYEADSVDAAQHVAANIGLCLWLFWNHRLVDPERAWPAGQVQRQAVRWLGLSEWICDRFGVGGGSAWNIIFLLRIARGNCVPVASASGPTIDAFRAQQPLSLAEAVDALRPFHAPFSRAKGFISWSSLAGFALDEHDAGHVHYGALQLANLLLEASWFRAYEQGITPSACEAVERLAGQLGALRPAERRFFGAAIDALPGELQAAAADAARAARGKRRPAPARAA
ncbi:hypothetical protein CURE108131_09220 [Cupriavidus respiraculi]|uniref:Uncharacterized protein n=1 Tax=Cupriavidus respiraculi TaxID=195930 RepID=A0ABN7Y5K5_9BURK|nr:hypothetical protein [Cupriavidus respiraculi]CAG9168679.1 hypothetical protein LMG21510_01192 [Cupriavidus respiraculi]